MPKLNTFTLSFQHQVWLPQLICLSLAFASVMYTASNKEKLNTYKHKTHYHIKEEVKNELSHKKQRFKKKKIKIVMKSHNNKKEKKKITEVTLLQIDAGISYLFFSSKHEPNYQ